MSVLKIKDQNGQWTDVLSIKGEKGDNGQDYVLTENDKQEIAQDVAELVDIPVDDVQINGTSIVQDGVAEIPVGGQNKFGVFYAYQTDGVASLSDGRLVINPSTDDQIKGSQSTRRPIIPAQLDKATFYGLAKASGDTTQAQSSNAVGTYTDEAKASIQSMFGVANKADKLIITIGTIINSANKIYQIDNTYVNIASALRNGATVIVYNDPEVFPYVGMATIDNNPVLAFGTSTTFNGTAILSGYLILQNNTAMKVNQLTTIPTATSQLTNDSLIGDVQIDGVSIVTDGVANIPYITTAKNYGLTKLARDASASGLWVDDRDGILYVATASVVNIKAGTNRFAPITPIRSDASTFYGLAKAAGHDEKDSTLPVGQYTESAKSAISSMLNAPESVSGMTPTITAKAGVRYICGECTTLDITTPESGIVDITFTSGATPTVLTVTPPTGMTMMWANGFDSTALEANTVYEINIMDGCKGVACSWT